MAHGSISARPRGAGDPRLDPRHDVGSGRPTSAVGAVARAGVGVSVGLLGCGAAERSLAKVEVEGSNPFSRFLRKPRLQVGVFSFLGLGLDRKGEFEQGVDRLLVKGRARTLNDFSSVEDQDCR